MTAGGWVFMLFSITAVVSLATFCFYRVLSKPSATERMHSTADIEPEDKDA